MKKKTGLVFAFLLVLLGVQGAVFGFDQEDMVMHGFASQGYLKSSDNNYLGNSEDGSYEFNEIGINFMVPVTDDLRFGIQLFSRDLGDYGNNDLVVDWALLDYNINQYLGFRAGKVKMPYGIRNRSRDVDNLRTSIILNQSVYVEGLRDFTVALYGANLYGSAPLGMMGTLDYDLLAGTLDIPVDTAFIKDAIDRMNLDVDVDITVRYFAGGQLMWATSFPGLSVSATAYQGKIDATMEMALFPEPIETEVSIKEFYVLSAKYDIRNFSVIFERQVMYTTIGVMGQKMITKRDGWYGEASYKINRWFEAGISYGEYYPDANDKKGRLLEKDDYPDYYAWQKDTTFSSKFNFNEYLCLKFEVHYIDGLGLTEIDDYQEGEMRKHWFLYAFKTSINF